MTLAAETTAFRKVHEEVARRADDGLGSVREAAFEAFERAGLPTTRLEAWRSTPTSALGKIPFHAPVARPSSSPAAHEMSLSGHQGIRIVLVNGRFAPELSRLATLPDDVKVASLAAARRERRAEIDALLFSLVSSREAGAFPALNAALFEDGTWVSVPKGLALETPIQVIHVADAAGEPVLCSPRLLVTLGENAQATIVETHGGRAGESLTNAVAEIALAPGAVLEHVQVQIQAPSAFQVATTSVRVDRAATYRSHVFSLGARLSRHDLNVELAGEGASTELYGLSLLGGTQHADHHTFVNHAVPHGSSNQVYDGAFGGASRGVFNGAVRVAPHAQKTDAHQKNRNLILSADALVDSKPELEIHADDVKCTHGATIGQLEESQLFYLLARGIDPAEARAMLVRGFVQGQVDRVRHEATRVDIAARVHARIAEIDAASGAAGERA